MEHSITSLFKKKDKKQTALIRINNYFILIHFVLLFLFTYILIWWEKIELLITLICCVNDENIHDRIMHDSVIHALKGRVNLPLTSYCSHGLLNGVF